MTTCTLQLVGLPHGRRQVRAIRYGGPPKSAERQDVHFPSFAPGLSEIYAFQSWAKENGLKVELPDHLTYAVACKQRHLLVFWQLVYAPALVRAANDLASGDKVLRERNERTILEAMKLRRELEQLNSRRLYALIAYEY